MELQNCMNYLLSGAQHQVFQLTSERLLPYGVTPGQYGVLYCLWQNRVMTPKDIAQMLGLEKTKGSLDFGADAGEFPCRG